MRLISGYYIVSTAILRSTATYVKETTSNAVVYGISGDSILSLNTQTKNYIEPSFNAVSNLRRFLGRIKTYSWV